MPKYVALLRGINVGTAKRVAMADLRALFEELGYKDVKTLLNSGNVIFSGGKVSEDKIEKAFEKRFGFSSRFTILTATEVEAVVKGNPISEFTDPSRFFVAFLKTPAHRDLLRGVAGAKWHPDIFALGARVAYMWCPSGALQSKLNEAVNKALKDAVTVRNWATVLKLMSPAEG
jgi:uncharacterized protein (DUF1697 family)